MKKTWVKRSDIYYKPFWKQKSKMLLLFIFLLGIIFFFYQAFSVNQLPNTSTPFSLEDTMNHLKRKHKQMQQSLGRRQPDTYEGVAAVAGAAAPQSLQQTASEEPIKIIRGTRLYDYDDYKPNFEGKFRCLNGSLDIVFSKVNDDYCDCPDGSDEPSTNACPNGKFYCQYQKRHITGRGPDAFVPSNRINDGICDCCDGSDEWKTIKCANKCF